jgi:hypothetical protein
MENNKITTRFKSGGTYRHITSQDLDILVIRVPYYDEKRSKLKIHWVDKRNGKIRHLPGGRADGKDSIEIKAVDYKNWMRIA